MATAGRWLISAGVMVVAFRMWQLHIRKVEQPARGPGGGRHTRRLGHLPHPAAKSQAAGDCRGARRVQVRLARQPQVERLKLPGRLQQ